MAGGPAHVPVMIWSDYMKADSLRSRRAVALFLSATFASCMQAQVDINTEGDHLAISIHGQPFTNFYTGPNYPKPFLAPLRTANGLIVTRKFPMESVDGESRDHPHHRGLFIGHHDINGVNFWENEFSYTTTNRGKIILRHVDDVKPGKKSGSVSATFEWVDTHGVPILEEHRIMVFSGDKDTRTIDVDLTLTAKVEARFADDKDAFFAIRVADSMAEKNGGTMTNSEGSVSEKQVWGKRADWVDYDGTVQGTKVGIAILDYPENYNHPPRWHSRGYGLFAVNPFMVKDADPKSNEHGGYDLAAGKALRFRYRVIIHPGDVSMKKVASWYSDYKKK
jgi:Methane oxygenase PmoA